MVDSVVENLIHDLLEWLSARERTYDEVMDAWRTSCPRLSVWEDANDRGFVALKEMNGRNIVTVTSVGFAFLQHRNASASETAATS